jgi:hypothetical protein
MYRAQRIAEYTIYDGDPHLLDHELDFYLKVSAEEIRAVTAKYLSVEDRVVLDIVPAVAAQAVEVVAPASAQAAGDASQPAAPAPQIPARPRSEAPPAGTVEGPLTPGSQPAKKPSQLSEPPAQNEPGSEPVHP